MDGSCEFNDAKDLARLGHARVTLRIFRPRNDQRMTPIGAQPSARFDISLPAA
jgi:Ethanolamine utilization protein EutJ (predicted chaperonin)